MTRQLSRRLSLYLPTSKPRLCRVIHRSSTYLYYLTYPSSQSPTFSQLNPLIIASQPSHQTLSASPQLQPSASHQQTLHKKKNDKQIRRPSRRSPSLLNPNRFPRRRPSRQLSIPIPAPTRTRRLFGRKLRLRQLPLPGPRLPLSVSATALRRRILSAGPADGIPSTSGCVRARWIPSTRRLLCAAGAVLGSTEGWKRRVYGGFTG